MKVDNETGEALTTAKDIKEMMNTRGWKHFQKSLADKILELQMISSIEGKTMEEKMRSMEVNQKVAESLYQILSDIVSTPNQVANNTQYLDIEETTIFSEE